MFTGIVETIAKVLDIKSQGGNKTFILESPISDELKIDQSLSHNGVCLTVENCNSEQYAVTAIAETLAKTNVGDWQIGDKINLERCMPAGGRFDGHIVQGHVDQTGICEEIADQDGSWKIRFSYDPIPGNITVEKGSVCVNGISLTVIDSNSNSFSVAIIPYTWENTNMHYLQVGDRINLEFDILGKYMQKIMRQYNKLN